MTIIDAAGETPRPEMAEYRSENGFVVVDAAIMLLSADLTAAPRTGATFCRAKRSSSAPAGLCAVLLVHCGPRLCLLAGFAVVGVVEEEVRRWSGVTMSNPGSLGRESGYDEDNDVMATLPSVTGLRRARLRPCGGGGEETLKELLDVDRLALAADRPSETLSDIIVASLVVANSLAVHPSIA